MQDRRSLTSIDVARWPLPWRWRRRAVLLEIRRRSEAHLAARLSCVDHATVLRRHAENRQVLSTDLPVWQFWAPDPERAPALVRNCMQSVAEHLSDRTVTVLDPTSYGEFVRLPQHIEARRDQMGWTHFSDLLRIWLLAEHGGTWIDATVMMSAPMPAHVDEVPFFAFSRPEDPFLLSSWFLHARPAHPIVLALRDMLDDYWCHHETLVDYFLLHFMFESAVTVDRRLRRMWMDVPVHSFEPPHRLQSVLASDFDEHFLQEILAASWLHKLTWKMPPAALDEGRFGEVLGRL